MDRARRRNLEVTACQRPLELAAAILRQLEERTTAVAGGRVPILTRRRLPGRPRPRLRLERHETKAVQIDPAAGLDPALHPGPADGDEAAAAHLEGSRVEIEDGRGVLGHPQDRDALREQSLQLEEAALPHVAVAGVMRPAF